MSSAYLTVYSLKDVANPSRLLQADDESTSMSTLVLIYNCLHDSTVRRYVHIIIQSVWLTGAVSFA